MGRHNSTDYAFLAKSGFFIGLGLVGFGIAGLVLSQIFHYTLPAWLSSLLLYSEISGLIIGFSSVWLFGVVLPLLE